MQKARRHILKMLRPLVSVWFQVFSPPFSGYFSPFPHGTCSLSVSQEYLALPDGAGSFNRNFTCSDLLRILTVYIWLPRRGFHPLWLNFPDNLSFLVYTLCQSYNPIAAETAMVWAISLSLATTNEITIVFFSSGYLDVSVPRVCLLSDTTALLQWVFPFGDPWINSYNQSPWLIAVYHVLHRLWEPRHPPYALTYFLKFRVFLKIVVTT